ncbi:MAG: radical SAM protein [Bacteroidales bacterium]|nr:radical SAM protein [Bacteroidales bacterium]
MRFFLSKSKTSKKFDDYNKLRAKSDRGSFCHAPSKSLYIGQNGNVFPCCYNRKIVLGNIFKNSISEIRHGDKCLQLQKKLKENELDAGCIVCEQALNQRNFHQIKAHLYDNLPNQIEFPSILEFEIDNTCNCTCIMCTAYYSSSFLLQNKKEKLDNKFIFKQLEGFNEKLIDAKFNGGEPFLIDIYYDIWERIISTNPHCRISVQTNGTVLNDKVKNLMSRGNFHISVSIDALNKELFEKIRINAYFDKVIANFKYFRDYCLIKNTYIGISVCPMQTNIFEIPKLTHFAIENHAHISFQTVWFPPSLALWNMPLDKLEEAFLNLKKQNWEKYDTPLALNNIEAYNSILMQLESWINLRKTEIIPEYLSSQTFEEIIFKKIDSWCDNNFTNTQENNNKKNFYKDSVSNILNDFVSEESNSQIDYSSILRTPIDLIIAEIETNNNGSLKARFKTYLL